MTGSPFTGTLTCDGDGTLRPPAVNDAIEGPYGDRFVGDPRGDSFSRLDRTHAASAPLPTGGSVSVSFVVPEDELGVGERVGELTFP